MNELVNNLPISMIRDLVNTITPYGVHLVLYPILAVGKGPPHPDRQFVSASALPVPSRKRSRIRRFTAGTHSD